MGLSLLPLRREAVLGVFRPSVVFTAVSLFAIYSILSPNARLISPLVVGETPRNETEKAVKVVSEGGFTAGKVGRVGLSNIFSSSPRLSEMQLSAEIIRIGERLEKGDYTTAEQMLRSLVRISSHAMNTTHVCEVREIFDRFVEGYLGLGKRAAALKIASLAPDSEIQTYLRKYIESAELRAFVNELKAIGRLIEKGQADQARRLYLKAVESPIAQSTEASYYLDCWARPLEGISALVSDDAESDSRIGFRPG